MKKLLILVSFLLSFLQLQSQCDHPDYDELMKLYDDLDGDNWLQNEGWGEDCKPCEWFGVMCDEDERVLEIELASNNLKGQLSNYNFTNLTGLVLVNSEITGTIPDFGNLPELSILDLTQNELTGSIPALINTPKLRFLKLGSNHLNGSIPDFSNIQSLESILLRENRLSGCYPHKNWCQIDYDFSQNPKLPFEGDFEKYCNGGEQIGATCDDGNLNTTDDVIQDDCSCGDIISDCSNPWIKTDCSILSIVHNVSLAENLSFDIEGYTFEDGDEIGLFYRNEIGELTCMDFVSYYSGQEIDIKACEDDPLTPEKDGFAQGEAFIFNIWDCSEETEVTNIFPIYNPKGFIDENLPDATSFFGEGLLSQVKRFGTPSSDCFNTRIISCGETEGWDTEFGASNDFVYNCTSHKMDGKEVIYEFINDQVQDINISLRGLSQDLDLFLLDQCIRNTCLYTSDRTGVVNECILVEDLPIGKYYIIVDGYNEAESSYQLSIDCQEDLTGQLNCNNAIEVECNQTIQGNTNDGFTSQHAYPACLNYCYNGKEMVYSYTSPGNELMKIFLTDLSTDLDLIIFESCNENNCIEFSNRSQDESEAVVFRPKTNRTYYIVIDSESGSEGTFNLQLNCTTFGGGGGSGGFQDLDCSNAIPLQCNQPIESTNANGMAREEVYSGCSGLTFGREVIFTFELEESQDIEIRVTELEEDRNLDVFLLGTCSILSNACVEVGDKDGSSDEILVVEALPKGEYFIVVDGLFLEDVSSFSIEIVCEQTSIDCQTFLLKAGQNLVSTYLIPNEASFKSILNNPNVQGVRTEDVAFFLPPNFSSESWDYKESYVIQSIEATEIEVCGTIADSTEAIPLRGNYLNYVSYLKQEPQNVDVVYSDSDIFNFVRSQQVSDGSIEQFIPPNFGIFEIESPMGLLVSTNQPTEIIYGLSGDDIPVLGYSISDSIIVDNGCEHFVLTYRPTPNLSTIAIQNTALISVMNIDDEIGIFNQSGLLCGSAKYEEESLGLVVFGDFEETEDILEGLLSGEAYQIRKYDVAEGLEYFLEPSFLIGDGNHYSGGHSEIDWFELGEVNSVNFADKSSNNLIVYPNPTNNTISIMLKDKSDLIKSFKITSLQGELVFEFKSSIYSNRQDVSLTDLNSGIYILTVVNSKGEFAHKKIVKI